MSRPVADSGDWIVCLNDEREVIDGHVACPLQPGPPTPIEDCATCRHLAWRRDERDRDDDCSTDPFISQ